MSDSPMLDAVVDLSHHNGDVDLAAAKADGILGIIHKATQGAVFVDPLVAVNRSKAHAAGLYWGAYHVGTGGDGMAQATHFLETAQPEEHDLLVLDLERNLLGPSMALHQARAFVTEVQRTTGRWPGVYGGQYLKVLLGDQSDPVLGHCWFWLAQYGTAPVVPPTWRTWTLWQYTDGVHGAAPQPVNGIGRCDRDRFHGDAATLVRFWGKPAERSLAAAVRGEESRL